MAIAIGIAIVSVIICALAVLGMSNNQAQVQNYSQVISAPNFTVNRLLAFQDREFHTGKGINLTYGLYVVPLSPACSAIWATGQGLR